MCKGVHRIHSRKICHRDIKPNNFFLFPKHDVRLGDFGTAKLLDGSMPDIRNSYLLAVGHKHYLAPEILCQIGIADNISYLSDIFALGAVLFELFSQQVLYQHIYSTKVLNKIFLLRETLSNMSLKNRIDTYVGVIDTIESSVNAPNIYDFNSFVPKSIRSIINTLYRDLTRFDFSKRLNDFQTIHRRLDICLLILRNQEKYIRWTTRKR